MRTFFKALFALPRLVFIAWIALRFGLLSGQTRAIRLRLALEALGPVFVKLGQVLSTRPDLLPADIAQELSKLQDRVPPFSGAIAQKSIEQSLGKPLDDVFSSFDPIPAASASISQVHFATLKKPAQGHSEIAIKVLRPGILKIIEKDLALMHLLAQIVHALSSDGRRLKPREVVNEFDTYLHDELDMMREAANAVQLKRQMKGPALVLIPDMLWDYCRTDLLVMERMSGIPINRVDALKAAGVDLPKLAREGIIIFYTQVFQNGFFHADMHPGNILVSTEPRTLGMPILLDFGIVGSLTQVDKDYLTHNFLAFFRRDYRRVAELHVESGWVPADTRVEELESAIRTCCEPYFGKPIKDISLGVVLLRLFQTSRRFHVEIQPQLVLLQKTLLNVEGLARELDPDLDLWKTAKPFLENWMDEQVGFKHLLSEIKARAPLYMKLLPELPLLIHSFLKQQVENTASHAAATQSTAASSKQ